MALETDPFGTDPHAAGAKLDDGKNRLGLVLGSFAVALNQVGLVGTFGAKKYSDNGWMGVPNGIARYEDAMLRHWVRYRCGETHDKDSGLHHLSHLAWNALAILTLSITNKRKVDGS